MIDSFDLHDLHDVHCLQDWNVKTKNIKNIKYYKPMLGIIKFSEPPSGGFFYNNKVFYGQT